MSRGGGRLPRGSTGTVVLRVMRRPIDLLAVLWPALAMAAQQPPPARIASAAFPTVATRCQFFEDRINSPDAVVRQRVLVEVGAFTLVPGDEYVRFLRQMLRDQDAAVSGNALKKLYDLCVNIPVDQLPARFAGYAGQVIDRGDATTVDKLREACRTSGTVAGYAAYALGLLRAKEAVPELRHLAADPNIFVRHSAARALLACDDKASARAILVQIIDEQLELYRAQAAHPTAGREGREPYYAVEACRAFMELGPEEFEAGLDRFLMLFEYMEKSKEINDQSHLHDLRQILSGLAGRYLEDAAAVRSWREGSRKR